MSNSRYLFTFGYEGLDIKEFIDHLKSMRIRTVVDVRELPLSRKKGFSKTAFCEQLHQAGIVYLHAPALGCPKSIRDRYRKDGDWKKYSEGFLAYLKSQREPLQELARISRATAACLVCFEADYTHCHRSYVARAAHRLGAPEVRHLTAKTAVPDQPLRLVA